MPHASTALGADYESESGRPNSKPNQQAQQELYGCVYARNGALKCWRSTRGRGRKGSMHCSTIERSARCSCCCCGSCCVVVVAVAVAQHALVNYTLICCVKCLFNGSRCRHVFHTFIHSSRSTCSTQKCPLCLLLPLLFPL